ncbi:hypothetical protein CERZMDRAFT_95063 [Cercospora zeae-maydis SCOH1-5]|uniref:Methyltransferase domain-containing protein n=1 Tax=Cercospora zeae-maydis SCOH1-5 TaxID=717836 RepID=A0A6A6FMP4_9PEZI|nr:hypothetical protein CERZMDRAFT_95063 [Cercospora zeae-maydis SCOH1-5]
MTPLSSWLDTLNLAIPGRRWQLVDDLGDLWFLAFLESYIITCRTTLPPPGLGTSRYVVQTQSPAALAAEVIHEHVQALGIDEQPWRVIDMCSGSGRLASCIESSVNSRRLATTQKPVSFQLSDLHPHAQLDAWMDQASRSQNLTFIPQAVHPARPPFAAISSTTRGDKDAALQQGYESNGTRVYRLMSSFHRFDENQAVAILQSTLQTADAFAIIELQERRVLSLFLILLETWICFLFSIFWFRADVTHLLFTYLIPLLPVMQCLDRMVSCLRTRSTEETIALVEKAAGHERRLRSSPHEVDCVEIHDWTITRHRLLHTWPIGHMIIFTGSKSSGRSSVE